MTMREKIARAAWEKTRELCGSNGVETLPWDEIEAKEHHLLVSDAVLDAMREPSEELVNRGKQHLPFSLANAGSPGSQERLADHAKRVWRAMIDAAKEER